MRKVLILSVASLPLAGCFYGDHWEPPVQAVAIGGTMYRVSTNLELDRIWTSSDAAVRDKAKHEAAARKFLDDMGRANCQIVSGKEIMKPQFEFMISCLPAS